MVGVLLMRNIYVKFNELEDNRWSACRFTVGEGNKFEKRHVIR